MTIYDFRRWPRNSDDFRRWHVTPTISDDDLTTPTIPDDDPTTLTIFENDPTTPMIFEDDLIIPMISEDDPTTPMMMMWLSNNSLLNSSVIRIFRERHFWSWLGYMTTSCKVGLFFNKPPASFSHIKWRGLGDYLPLLQRLHVTLHHVCMLEGCCSQYPRLFHDWPLDLGASSLHEPESNKERHFKPASV